MVGHGGWGIEEADGALGGVDAQFCDNGEVTRGVEVALDVTLERGNVVVVGVFGGIVAVDSMVKGGHR